jgi:hypothetical protein
MLLSTHPMSMLIDNAPSAAVGRSAVRRLR